MLCKVNGVLPVMHRQSQSKQQAAAMPNRLLLPHGAACCPALQSLSADCCPSCAACSQKMRELKRQQVRQRREQAHQEALAAKKQSIMASPRPGEQNFMQS